MDVLTAVILGLIQGLSEFIPISSTAHLTLAGYLLGNIDAAQPEKWTSFIATIQLGTLLAVFVYFAKEIRDIPTAFLKENFGKGKLPYKEQSTNSKFAYFITFGTVPIVAVGLLIKKLIEGGLTKDPIVIGISLIVLALILAIAEKLGKFTKENKDLTLKDAILVGLAQCLALIPGASRSGTTITAGLFLGMKRDTAAKFSFLLSIPAVLASGLLEFYQGLKYINSGDMIALVIATAVAAISGYISIALLIKFLKTRTTYIFVVYRIILGIVVLSYFIK
jgi:undecaprenyl-diphosphatase